MNRRTQAAVRQFKDSTGQCLWQPPAVAAAALMTLPVLDAEDMPDIAANSLSIAFGVFFRGYLIVDHAGVSVPGDPYSAKPYVLFYTTKRVGGGSRDFDVVKVTKFAASDGGGGWRVRRATPGYRATDRCRRSVPSASARWRRRRPAR